LVDVASLHVPVVDPEYEDQQNLGDEQDAKEKGEAAQRRAPAPLECEVIDLIDCGAEDVKSRQRDDRRNDRIDAELDVEQIGDV
jgi:hypothetical protein